MCSPIGDLYPGSRADFKVSGTKTFPGYTGTTAGIASGSFGDNILTTTLKHDGTLYTNAYFASNFKVRVSKPSVATV
jgi:hypothetical protein